MALRLVRIFTGRRRVLKFAGHFHGWNDFLVPAADAPYATAIPGVAAEVAADTVVVPPNDASAVEAALAKDPDIGCVILEPTGGHFGAVPIRGDFLRPARADDPAWPAPHFRRGDHRLSRSPERRSRSLRRDP